MIKAVIIEDDMISTEVLKKQLSVYCPEVKLIAEYSSGNEALANLAKLNFDLLFLDIELGDMTAFDLLGALPEDEYRIIFTTTFKEFALNAIKVNAIDYLVKPIDGKELRIAVNKAMEKIIGTNIRQRLIKSYHEITNERMMVFNGNYWFIDYKDILLLKSDGGYTQIHYLDTLGNVLTHLESKLLKHFEENLKQHGFIRIHKSYMVNRSFITGIITKPAQVVLSNGFQYDISRDRKSQVLKELSE